MRLGRFFLFILFCILIAIPLYSSQITLPSAGAGDLWSDPVDSTFTPDTPNTYDIGATSFEFKDLFLIGDAFTGRVAVGTTDLAGAILRSRRLDSISGATNSVSSIFVTDTTLTANKSGFSVAGQFANISENSTFINSGKQLTIDVFTQKKGSGASTALIAGIQMNHTNTLGAATTVALIHGATSFTGGSITTFYGLRFPDPNPNNFAPGTLRWISQEDSDGQNNFVADVAIGTLSTPTEALDVTGKIISDETITGGNQTESLTVDDTVVTVAQNTLVLDSNNATGANRTFTLTNGSRIGQTLVIILDAPGFEAEIADAGNACLTGLRNFTDADTLSLVWVTASTCWHETGRSDN